MKPELQQMAIAKSCGYRYTGMGIWIHPKGYELFGTRSDVLPNYLTDLNEIQKAYKNLIPEMRQKCYGELTFLMQLGESVFCCSAAQWSEAYLKALKLWKPHETSQDPYNPS